MVIIKHPPRFTPAYARRNVVIDGVKMCALCKEKPIGKGMRKYCSTECSEKSSIIAGHTWIVEKKLLERDNGICVVCGMDCVRAYKDYKAAPRLTALTDFEKHYPRYAREIGKYDYTEFIAKYGTVPKLGNSMRLWHIDHILPVEHGGGSCGLENLQTLCWKCHNLKTAEQKRAKSAKAK